MWQERKGSGRERERKSGVEKTERGCGDGEITRLFFLSHARERERKREEKRKMGELRDRRKRDEEEEKCDKIEEEGEVAAEGGNGERIFSSVRTRTHAT